MGFCEHCGSRVSSYPMGCPGCGAPECCQRCCDEQNKNDRIAALESRVRELEAERDKLLKRLKRATELCASQAEDEGIWFIAETITEDYLQRALRNLHRAIEE